MDVKLYKWPVMMYECVGISSTSLAMDYHFQRAGIPKKNMPMSSRICMTYSEEPRTADNGLRLPNETEYSFADFMTRKYMYCL